MTYGDGVAVAVVVEPLQPLDAVDALQPLALQLGQRLARLVALDRRVDARLQPATATSTPCFQSFSGRSHELHAALQRTCPNLSVPPNAAAKPKFWSF